MPNCPECGCDMATRDPIKHAVSHYGKLEPAGGNKVKHNVRDPKFDETRLRALLKLSDVELV